MKEKLKIRKPWLRWKLFAALVTALAVGLGVCGLFFSRPQERKEFVSKTDPKSGYRCRFTIPANWKVHSTGPNLYSKMPEFDVFTPSLSPMQQWIALHLFHQTAPKGGPRGIILACGTNASASGLMPQEQNPKQRHFFIDGCPATIVHSASTFPGDPPFLTRLTVSVPFQSIQYEMYATVDSPDIDQIGREMETIISSFHVDKTVK